MTRINLYYHQQLLPYLKRAPHNKQQARLRVSPVATPATSLEPQVSNHQREQVQQLPQLFADSIPVPSQGMNSIKISFDDIEDEVKY